MGWTVRIDLEGTELATRPFRPRHWDYPGGDRYDIQVADGAFVAKCSPLNLSW